MLELAERVPSTGARGRFTPQFIPPRARETVRAAKQQLRESRNLGADLAKETNGTALILHTSTRTTSKWSLPPSPLPPAFASARPRARVRFAAPLVATHASTGCVPPPRRPDPTRQSPYPITPLPPAARDNRGHHRRGRPPEGYHCQHKWWWSRQHRLLAREDPRSARPLGDPQHRRLPR